MMRVCYIVSDDLWAGAEVMAWNLIRTLHASGKVAVQVIALNPGRLSRSLEQEGVRVFVVSEARLSFATLLVRVRGILKATAPDIVHAHRYKENILAFLAGGVFRRPRLVSTQHGMPETSPRDAGLAKRCTSKLNTLLLTYGFQRYVCVSDDLRKTMARSFGLTGGKACVVYNGVAFSGTLPPRTEGQTVTIGSAGRFYPVKDFALMIDVARVVRQMLPFVRFRLAGDGPLRAELQAQAEACGLQGCFLFSGHVSDMPTFYRSIDIYLNTSVHEGIPMSILEAMAAGVPVVAPDVGGIGEIITHGTDGYLMPTRHPEDFARCLAPLCESSQLRRQVAEQAAVTVRDRFSAAAMADRYYQLYEGLLASPEGER
ncbi:glycosyltransferase family 4 protein [Desulfoluna spongiiphila]|uniref:Glycosyltransferase involved in cell wall bisynthesis n=1 Tax=Desulfoluna spongiiphila TaxID=419481 RepID=A0A1G5C2R4_9BACT|nr:glycosyltransferase family 4 protein [Desulfoluna spongiiphila]SCX96769.1 Glycosyltransferase involved in cell wall bisynthesis [Desulfoluna spongiiphila]